MKVGDSVHLVNDESSQKVWVVTAVKSTSRGFWIQLNDDCKIPDVWHNSKNYEVTNESG